MKTLNYNNNKESIDGNGKRLPQYPDEAVFRCYKVC